MTAVFAFGCSATDARQHELEGSFRMFIVDHADGRHETGYALKAVDGRYVELRFTAQPSFEVGDWLRVRGAPAERAAARSTVGDQLVAVGSAELVEPASDVAVVQERLAVGEPRTVKVAVVLLDFSGVAAQTFSKANADERLATVAAYYDEISYGNWKIEGDSFGPYTVAKPANCNLDTVGNLARQAAIDDGIAIDDYDHVGVTLPGNQASGLDCACGLAFVGRTPAQPSPEVADTSLYTCTDANAFAHEMGHGFGLHHAATASCGGESYVRDGYGNCAVAEYGNQFNTMGNGLGHFNAFQKSTMRWLDECNNVVVTRDGTFDVYPMQTATTAIQSLQIPNGETRDGNDLYYWVEYRNPDLADFNANDGGEVRELGLGVHIDVAADFREDGGERRPLLLDLSDAPGNFDDPRLTAGKSFSDPDGRVTIEVVSAGAEKAVIEVSFPDGGSGENLCVNGLTPPGVPGPPARLFQHCSYDGWKVPLEAGEYTTADLVALGALDNDASSISVAEGYEVDLFDGDDFTGNSVTLTASSTCLVDHSFNDVVSSIRVRAPDDGAGGAGGADGGAGTAGVAGTTGGGAGAAAGGSAGALAGGMAGTPMSAGSGGAGGAGMPAAMPDATRTASQGSRGCACRVPGKAGGSTGSSLPALLAALVPAAFLRRRRAG